MPLDNNLKMLLVIDGSEVYNSVVDALTPTLRTFLIESGVDMHGHKTMDELVTLCVIQNLQKNSGIVATFNPSLRISDNNFALIEVANNIYSNADLINKILIRVDGISPILFYDQISVQYPGIITLGYQRG